ncbi:MAG: hypothetical protein RBS27_16385, partial [Giesbergeria sp.]|nr:hypothetical protein [Giesbergeria sp.]
RVHGDAVAMNFLRSLHAVCPERNMHFSAGSYRQAIFMHHAMPLHFLPLNIFKANINNRQQLFFQ